MKLNHDCIRAMLLTLEQELSYNESLIIQEIDLDQMCGFPLMANYSREDIAYSAEKMSEAGFISYSPRYADNSLYDAFFEDITYEGHQYLDAIRQDTIWNKIKLKMASSGGSLTFSLIQALGIAFLKSQLGL